MSTSEQPLAAQSRCQALTAQGTACTRRVRPGQTRCWQHAQGIRAKWRSLSTPLRIASALFTAVVGFATIVGVVVTWPSSSRPYPWIYPLDEIPDSNHNPQKMGIVAEVRDEPLPREEQFGLASMSSLYNLHITIDLPVAVSPTENEWSSCRVADFHSPEWNNDSGSTRVLAWVPLQRDNTLLEFHATARNGQWNGAILLRRSGPSLTKQIALRGSLVSSWWQKSTMSVDETHDGHSVKPTSGDIYPLTKEVLVKYGVPITNPAEAVRQCHSGSTMIAEQ